MGDQQKAPRYMTQLLDALGWNQGTRIPLANPDNQNLETLLIDRQNEIQRLKEALTLQNQKTSDLNNYKQHVHTEYQENTRLLFAHKQQLEQEVKLRQLSCNDSDSLARDITATNKQSKDISERIDKYQASITRLLKKADSLKSEVCGERGALQEWRAQLERNSGDISAIEQFTKQDVSKAKALETKRQKLKVEHDHMLDRLNQLVSNLSAEERACERISVQVMEGMEQRRQMMVMWTSAVENLRQRDTDIRHIKEDYEVLQVEANNIADKCREQQSFCDQQASNNAEAVRANMGLAQQLSNLRLVHQQLLDVNATLHSSAQCSQRELHSMHSTLEKLHMENRRIMEQQHRKDVALKEIINKIKELKAKLAESMDKTKTSEQRAKELEVILQEEERYASNLTLNQQRAMHCSFVEQQKLLALKNEEKLFNMHLKASKAIVSKLEKKQAEVLKNLQSVKESLYNICYQVETIGSQVSHMEGAQSEREVSAELLARENRLLEVRARHAARAALLERHSAKLQDDMRRLARELDHFVTTHVALQSRLRTSMLNVEGSEKDLRASRVEWRRARVEEALTRLRVAHASRALASLDDRAYNADTQRLRLDAAMNERLVEIMARREMFSVQVRALTEDCGKLRGEIKERENRIDQLKKRYDIFIASLGKDESGQQLSVTFFKIKFAAERAELRERGAALDADIGRQERDISALEATLRVVHAAHTHFLHHITPLARDSQYCCTSRYCRVDIGRQERDISALEATLRVVHAAHTHFLHHITPLARDSQYCCTSRYCRVDIGRQERDISALEATLRVVHAAHTHFLHHITPLARDSQYCCTSRYCRVDIGRQERDISALEATLRVVHAAHTHFLHHITPLARDTPEIQELDELMKKYYQVRDELKDLYNATASMELRVQDASARATALHDKCKQLEQRQADCENELDNLKDRISKHEGRLQNALDVVKNNAKRAKKIFDNVDDWRIFQLALWIRDYSEAASGALEALAETCAGVAAVYSHFAALVASADLQRYVTRHQRRLHLLVERLQADSRIGLPGDDEESVFSSSVSSLRSGMSITSGTTKRLAAFRKTLATKVQEPALIEDIPESALRSSVSLRVVTLGLERPSVSGAPSASGARLGKASR
ncbi:coiled-coil domain-containing protein 39 isoform X2 [Cydia pomonella]|uniref:coiled-coil domain-containing protein 39 isoform X2 n=1 Tax=Cydia pomonella TaxID=82600 RepID=UPI002ADE84E7|nr:coiled-coil domain-containing protein 39 isoform X2 [Cydia pomonella]